MIVKMSDGDLRVGWGGIATTELLTEPGAMIPIIILFISWGVYIHSRMMKLVPPSDVSSKFLVP